MTILIATLPNHGTGKLEMREDKKLLGTSKEGSLINFSELPVVQISSLIFWWLQCANSFYKSFAVECSKQQVCNHVLHHLLHKALIAFIKLMTMARQSLNILPSYLPWQEAC